MGNADHGALVHGGVLVEDLLDLPGIDVVAAPNDQLLLAVDDEVVAVVVDARQVAAVKPPVGGDRLRCRVWAAAGTHLPTPADAAEVANDGTGSTNASNFLGGGQVGCNWQTGMLVLGLEGDFDYFHGNANFFNNTNVLPSTGDPFTVGQSLKTDYLATVRPRFGIGVDRNFTYITGGAAFTKVNYAESYIDSLNGGTLPGTGMATAAKSLVGWVAGAGWEYALADHWTLKLEYLFAKFGTVKASGLITDAAGGVNALQGSADVTIQVARAGVNLKF